MSQTPTRKPAQNVLGQRLELCCSSPRTGFYRDGFCNTGPQDFGSHTVCAQVTEAFLAYTQQRGNDLSTPVPAYQFPGLKPGRSLVSLCLSLAGGDSCWGGPTHCPRGYP